MLTIAIANQRRPRCLRCGCLADLASVDEPARQAELFEIFSRNEMAKFSARIRELTNCSLAEAKATYLHLALAEGICHRCRTPLPPGSVVDCPKCQSLNVVWSSRINP